MEKQVDRMSQQQAMRKAETARVVMIVLEALDIDPSEVKAGRYFVHASDDQFSVDESPVDIAVRLLNVQFEVPVFTDQVQEILEAKKQQELAEIDALLEAM